MCTFKDFNKFGESNLTNLVLSVSSQLATVLISGLFGIYKNFHKWNQISKRIQSGPNWTCLYERAFQYLATV